MMILSATEIRKLSTFLAYELIQKSFRSDISSVQLEVNTETLDNSPEKTLLKTR
jgi:hypothetical protein